MYCTWRQGNIFLRLTKILCDFVSASYIGSVNYEFVCIFYDFPFVLEIRVLKQRIIIFAFNTFFKIESVVNIVAMSNTCRLKSMIGKKLMQYAS